MAPLPPHGSAATYRQPRAHRTAQSLVWSIAVAGADRTTAGVNDGSGAAPAAERVCASPVHDTNK
jgi:hypothetical protein